MSTGLFSISHDISYVSCESLHHGSPMFFCFLQATASHSQPLAFLQVQKEVKGLHDELAVVKAQAVAKLGSEGDDPGVPQVHPEIHRKRAMG